MKRIYFPNLNGLRFIAAFMVIIHHVEQLKSLFGINNYWETPFVHNLPVLLCSIGFFYFLIKWVGIYTLRYYPNYYLDVFNNFWQTLNFDCFAIGGLAAVVLRKELGVLKLLFLKSFQIITLLLTIFLLFNGITIPFIHFEFYSILFAVIILNLAANKETVINLEYSIFSYLGKISYGLYMYHVLAIVISIKLLQSAGIENFILLYVLTLILTIFISSVSYYFFEHKFISLKSKFSKIVTGDTVIEPEKIT
jgi:peptidoglycan/LPS O-acetylase OafA/YrhL